MHFLGIDWRDRKPYLIYRKDWQKLEESEIELKNGETFSIEVIDKKYCIGYRDTALGRSFLCPEQKSVWKKDRCQCFDCRNHETVHFFSLSSLNQEQTDLLKNKNHFNYLNLFGNDIVKVGVATEASKWRRILEQGADSTLFFTETDGITAREIENFVSQNFQIKQAVTYFQKIKLLKETIPSQESKSKLLQTYFQIKVLLPDKFKQYLIDTPEFSYNDKYYQLSSLDNIDEIVFIDDVNTGDIFSGEVIGIPGQILLYRKNKDYFALNTNKVKGFMVNISSSFRESKITASSKKVKFEKAKSNLSDVGLF